MFQQICQHITESTNNGPIIPTISIFPQRKPGGKDVVRIWNSQLISYAGYPCTHDPKAVIGDRGNVTFTQFCQSLGWKGKQGKKNRSFNSKNYWVHPTVLVTMP